MNAVEPTNQRPFIDPGWYKDLSNDDYHGSFGTSSSQLKKLIDKTPAHLKHSWSQPNETTKNMALGTAVHSLVLEPDKFDQDIAIEPVLNKRTNAGKEAAAAFAESSQGKTIITEKQLEKAHLMAESVRAHPMASVLLQDTLNESSVYWWYKTMDTDEIASGERYKELLKVRPDILCRSYPVVADLKSTVDASFTGFAKSIINFNYHVSAAMYLEGINQCKPLLEEMGYFAYTKFVFICVESEAPYLTAVYELSQDDLELGKQIYRACLRKLRDARENDFPGFPEDIRVIELPAWAKRGFIV